MRRRLMLLWTPLVLGLVLILPGSTLAAGGYSYVIKANYCSGDDNFFKVKTITAGFTPANGITVDMRAQWHPIGYGSWHTISGSYHQEHYYFAANGTKHWLTAWRWWYGNSSNWYRQVFTLKAWHNSTLLASKKVYSVKC